jgi:hypothetical protein
MLKTLEMGIGQRQTLGSELAVEIVGVEVAVNVEERGDKMKASKRLGATN